MYYGDDLPLHLKSAALSLTGLCGDVDDFLRSDDLSFLPDWLERYLPAFDIHLERLETLPPEVWAIPNGAHASAVSLGRNHGHSYSDIARKISRQRFGAIVAAALPGNLCNSLNVRYRPGKKPLELNAGVVADNWGLVKNESAGWAPFDVELLKLQIEKEFPAVVASPQADVLAAIAPDPDPPPPVPLGPESRAMALLIDHPDWSDVKIAAAVGVNRTQVYRWPKYKAAKLAMKGDLPKGSKTDGRIEADSVDIRGSRNGRKGRMEGEDD